MDRAALTAADIHLLARKADIGRSAIHRESLQPNKKREQPFFTPTRAAGLLGRTRPAVSKALRDMHWQWSGDHPAPFRTAIDQSALTSLARRFKRGPGSVQAPAVVVACMNQKGGVAKSTTSIHLAHYTSLLGWRTLLIDADSQASATAFFGVSPDLDIQEEETLFPILVGEHTDLTRLLRPAPHFQGLDFIPACLALAPANELAYARQYRKRYVAELADQHGFTYERDPFVFYDRLLVGIDAIRDQYDIVIIDCPPHVTPSTYNAIYAADFALVPFTPTIIDIASTLAFIEWLDEIMPRLPGLELARIKFLATNFDSSAAASEALAVIGSVLGDSLLKHCTYRSSEVQRAGSLLRSIYEVAQPMGSRDAWARACSSFDAVNAEILREISLIREKHTASLPKEPVRKGSRRMK